MTSALRSLIVILVMLAVAFLSPSHSGATERIYNQPADLLYQSASRFILLNKEFEITKEDKEIGLIVFTYVDGAVVDRKASIEVIRESTSQGANKVRLQVPSVSEGAVYLLMEELHKKIEADTGPAGIDEQMYSYPYEKLFPSIYRYLAVNKRHDVTFTDKERGIIYFTPADMSSASKRSWVEIMKTTQGAYKARIVIPNLASSYIRTYLTGIQEKLKSDYQKDN